MNVERKEENKEEIFPPSPIYWVRFRDIRLEDLDAILDIFEETTGKMPIPMGEEDYKKLCKKFMHPIGLAEWKIADGSILEWRRLIDQGRIFVRFKIGGVDRPNPAQPERSIQTRIDNYFIGKNKAIPASRIFSSPDSR